MGNIFTANPGFAGFYGPTKGGDVVVTFARGNATAKIDSTDMGFLADSYQVDWGRNVVQKRMLNVNGTVAIVGYGAGTVQFTGLLGTKEGLDKLLGTKSSNNADLCEPLSITIDGGASYTACEKGTAADGKKQGVKIVLKQAILNTFRITGSVQENGTLFQQATVAFTIGGMEYK